MGAQVSASFCKALLNLNVQEHQLFDLAVPPTITSGLDAIADGIVGRYQRRSGVFKSLETEALQIEELAAKWSSVSDHQLQEHLLQSRQIFRRRRIESDDSVYEGARCNPRSSRKKNRSAALFRATNRGLGASSRLPLAEMATGEGKTLTATLPAILAGWTKRPCHIVTANDYLAQRDAEWWRPLYQFCGVFGWYVTGQCLRRKRACLQARTSLTQPARKLSPTFCEIAFGLARCRTPREGSFRSS